MNGTNPTNPGLHGNAFGVLTDYANLAQHLWNVLQICADLKQRETTNAYSKIYQNTQTYTVNPDGTPGAVDGVPVPANPMVGTYLSRNDVDGFTGYCVNDIFDFLMGTRAPAMADRRPAIKGMLP